MTFSWTILLIVIFIITLLFSFTIEESTLKICYWLVVFLLALTIFNIMLSIQYYVQLRNDPGIKGPRGPPGRKGPEGLPGVCTVEDQCGVDTCRPRIVEIVKGVFPEIKCIDNIKYCDNDDKAQQAILLNQQIDILEAKCKESQDPVSVFINKIRPQIDAMASNGNANSDD